MEKSSLPDASLELVHPVYLDVPMMVSFLAALEGEGVAYEGESVSRKEEVEAREKAGSGRLGLPMISGFLGVDLSGRFRQSDEGTTTEETKVVREHTSASLFNLLRQKLQAENAFTEVSTVDAIPDLESGKLVELVGRAVGNPLQQILDAVHQMDPYLEAQEEEEAESIQAELDDVLPTLKGKKRSGSPSTAKPTDSQQEEAAGRAGELIAAGQKLTSDRRERKTLLMMREDVVGAEIRDLVLDDDAGLRAVLTLSKEFLTPQAEAQLLGGRFTVLGKVTNVLANGQAVNLTRRTALGLMGPKFAREMVEGFTETEEIDVEIGDPVVEGPAVQVLPLAVFI